MAWIELHQSIWTHKKTIMLSALLDIDELYAAAHMAKLWTWALDNTPDGDLSGLPPKVIAYGAGWKGDAIQFVDTLVQVGWLDENGEKTILHDWFDYAGRLIEKREANKNRMKNARATNVQRTNEARAGSTVPNRTVPNQNNNNPLNPHIEKTKFAEFVAMTNDEHQKLIVTYGEEFTKRCIDVLDNYKGSSGKRYKSDYRAILNWVINRVKEETPRAPGSGTEFVKISDEERERMRELYRKQTERNLARAT